MSGTKLLEGDPDSSSHLINALVAVEHADVIVRYTLDVVNSVSLWPAKAIHHLLEVLTTLDVGSSLGLGKKTKSVSKMLLHVVS